MVSGEVDAARAASRSRVLLVGALGLCAILVAGGVRKIPDGDFPAYLADLAHGRPASLDPHRSFLLEGVLGDAVAYALGTTDLVPETSAYLWWLGGLCLLACALAALVRRGTLTWTAVVAAALLTRLPDAFLIWIGKTDTLLVAALALTVARGRASLVGFAVAPLLHPLVSLVSAAGVLAVDFLDGGRVPWRRGLVALASCAADLLLFRLAFPSLEGRAGYFAAALPSLAASAAQWGLPNLVAGVALPAMSILVVAGRDATLPPLRAAPLALWLVGVGVITSFLVQDHTRDAGLVAFAPALAYLAHRRFGVGGAWPACGGLVLATLLVARLAAPHYDVYGPNVFRWVPIRDWAHRVAPGPAPGGDLAPRLANTSGRP